MSQTQVDDGSSLLCGSLHRSLSESLRFRVYTPLTLWSVYYLYSFIRKPRLILDFTLTLFLNHIIITTYYSAAFPTSLFFWFIMGLCAAIIILLAEQLCVRRELSQDFKPVTPTAHEDPEDPDEQNVELTSMIH
jgi:hypothetical protein